MFKKKVKMYKHADGLWYFFRPFDGVAELETKELDTTFGERHPVLSGWLMFTGGVMVFTLGTHLARGAGVAAANKMTGFDPNGPAAYPPSPVVLNLPSKQTVEMHPAA